MDQREARKKAEKALEKVHLLLARAASTHSTEEARTCAQVAAKLINEHHMVVSLDAPLPQVVASATTSPKSTGSVRREAEKRQRQSRQKQDQQRQARRTYGRYRPEPPPPPPPEPPRESHKIRAKYPGNCGQCGGRFDAGEEVIWFPGKCCIHVNCEDHPARKPWVPFDKL